MKSTKSKKKTIWCEFKAKIVNRGMNSKWVSAKSKKTNEKPYLEFGFGVKICKR